MSSNEPTAEILALSSGLDSFSNFQILSIDQSNSLSSVAPELVQFVSSCGSELNQLLSLSESSIFNQLIETNIEFAGSFSPCLEQLLGLEQLFSSGSDVQLSNSNDTNNNLNSTDASNSTASVSSASNNSTAAVALNSTEAQGQQAAKDASKGKDKNGKRSEIVQRSGATVRARGKSWAALDSV
jgi:hypothetical protein